MDMTFDEYIKNPMGVKNAVFSQRELYKALYQKKFDAVMLREKGVFSYRLYKDSKNYYIHIKIPSEVVEKFYYDVVIKFTPKDVSIKSLDKCKVQFFSNDPMFVFTFAHAFKTNDMLFTDLNPKTSKQALKKTASERNPKDEVGYVKSLYFAYLYMKQKNLFAKIQYVGADKYNKKNLLSVVMDADTKIDLRQEEGEKLRKAKKKERQQVETRKITSSANKVVTKTVKKTGKIGKTSSIGRVKHSKRF